MMNDIKNYCFHLSRSQGMSDLKAIGGDCGTMLVLRGVALSRRTSVGTRRLIRMPPGGVILFEFQINADQ